MSDLLPKRRSTTIGAWEPLRELEQVTKRARRMLDDTTRGRKPILPTAPPDHAERKEL